MVLKQWAAAFYGSMLETLETHYMHLAQWQGLLAPDTDTRPLIMWERQHYEKMASLCIVKGRLSTIMPPRWQDHEVAAVGLGLVKKAEKIWPKKLKGKISPYVQALVFGLLAGSVSEVKLWAYTMCFYVLRYKKPCTFTAWAEQWSSKMPSYEGYTYAWDSQRVVLPSGIINSYVDHPQYWFPWAKA